jgi:thiopurine S-methyltransferase
MIPKLNTEFWHSRWLNNETGWDIGCVSTPLKEYVDQLEDKNIKILIPGCGNAYEAEYLHKKGFTNVYVIDLSSTPLENLKKRVPNFPSEHLLTGDFFELSNISFDLIIEQTFFCAINPVLRKNYAQQCHHLLNPNGKIAGLLFNDTLNTDKPPFGGNKNEYEKYFSPYFNFKVFETCYNSIKPRENKELFILLQKK